jgi:glutamate-1-semialdehyde 2,1-aminomutase/spore coat polysaccharide biosynthesis protein SpsF
MTTAIIQARMGSTRLPNKTLMKIEGRPLLWHLLERIKKTKLVDRTVIATTHNPRDKSIMDFAKKYDVKVVRGNEDDVLDRTYRVAKEDKADTIVRVTPDCPLACPQIIDKVISEYLKGGYDYVTNTLLLTYPDGCDVEVFSFNALEEAWKKCKDPVGREHVTPYMRDSERFKIKNVVNKNPVEPGEYKWTVDRREDLEFVRTVYKHLYKEGRIFSYNKVMELLKRRPDIKKINSNRVTNEGYYRSILKTPEIRPKKIQIRKSLSLKKKAERLIPGCSQTLSKGPSQFIQGAAPIFLERGKGSRVWDVDGNRYIDYAMALGPVILGHNYPAVTDAVKRILEKSTTFTLPHQLEYRLAELLRDVIPCAEMVRFGKNGSDATSGAVRISRAYTDRDKIACCGYHGWQDWYVATTTRNKGVPKDVRKLTLTFEYNNIGSLEKLFKENKGQIACVIMEPVGIIKPENGFLKKVKELTHKNGALLIFDEVITGFRLSLGGAQEYFNVIPDIACFGKAMGNGFPISAIVGKKEIMRLFDEVFYSFTFGGEILSIAAAIETIKELKNKNVIQHLWEQGRRLKDGYNVLTKEYNLEKYTQCIGLPPRTIITFKNKKGQDDLLLKSLFQQECIRRGILFSGAHNICFSHSDRDVDYTLRVYNTALKIIKEAIHKNKVRKMLDGKPVEPVFRKT